MSDQGNSLAMGQGQATGSVPDNSPGPPDQPGLGGSPMDQHQGLMEHLEGNHAELKAKFDKLQAAGKLLSSVRSELDQLSALGDMVSADDVMKSSSKLVAAGMSAGAVAGLLADMPPDGPGLQEWVTLHDQGVKQREAQLEQVRANVQHELGVGAMKVLTAHALGPKAPDAMAPDPGQGPGNAPANPLSLGAPDAS
jgi:hypothetical protein